MRHFLVWFLLTVLLPGSAVAQPAERVPGDYQRAQKHLQNGELEAAIDLLEPLVRDHRHDPQLGGHAVDLLLDAYIRARRFDAFSVLVDDLLADRAYLQRDPQRLQRLTEIKSQLERKKLEELERAEKWQACGEGYRALYDRKHGGRHNDEVLYNAGVCFERAGALEQAVVTFEQISREFPRSPLARKALVWVGNLYSQTAQYELAAERFEAYAKKYAGENDASWALANAVLYRKALGHHRKAIADTELFVRNYGRKLRREAADAHFGMAALYDERKQARKLENHLERYLREFGRKGGRDRIVIAHAKLGQSLWRRSCTRPLALERCARARNGRLIKQARQHFRGAIVAARRLRPGDFPLHRAPRMTQARYWEAAARFYLADMELDAFLQTGDRARAKLAQAAYATLVESSASSHWSTAGAARLGQLAHELGDSQQAVREFRSCWQSRLGDWAQLCESELERRLPKEFPRKREIYHRAGYVAAPMSPQGPILTKAAAD